jgi:glutamate-1-semialdehyde 2,1-aminomutase
MMSDLACFGKALSNGFPLAAVVGKRDIFTAAVHRIEYTPTFKGEIHAFAAALAALAIYDDPTVAAGAWRFGERLMDAVTELCRTHGVPARVVGLPVRMVLAFEIADESVRRLARTLAAQELLRAGVLCFRGFMLPSAAHGEAELAQTLEAYELALQAVRRALERGSLAEELEIPEVVQLEAIRRRRRRRRRERSRLRTSRSSGAGLRAASCPSASRTRARRAACRAYGAADR